jgi:hypothetical protein
MSVYDSLHSLLDHERLSSTVTNGERLITAHALNSLMTSVWRITPPESESESELLYDWRYTANQFVLAPSPLRLMARIFFPQLNICAHSPYLG